MLSSSILALWALVSGHALALSASPGAANSTYYNPILPGFHPDPSCIFVPDWNNTYFCASSSFNAFPGIPIHASKDLQNWKLIGHVLNRKEQLPRLAETNRSTSGIWAPTIRYHEGTFWLLTTLVDDDRPQLDSSRWDNVIFKGKDPYNPLPWSDAVHFQFEGYDPEPYWHDNGKIYVTAAHAWQVYPAVEQAEINLETGKVGEWKIVWNGTGGLAPEGPHIYHKDGWYYLLVAEGGTGLNHMVTVARSRNVDGPFEPNPANPLLSNANTTSYFQTVGHADMFQDRAGNWWCVALSTRAGPEYLHYPMGRETVMVPATWPKDEWPYMSQVRGKMSGWAMPQATLDIGGNGPWIDEGDDVDFAPGSTLPSHFTYWRYPVAETFAISSQSDHPYSLRIQPSVLNLTALNGNYAGSNGQAFVGRRQQDTLFTYSVKIDFSPTMLEEEVGISAFLTQNHHLDLGVAMLRPAGNASAALAPHFRFRGISYVRVPDPLIVPVPDGWVGRALRMEIKAINVSHYAFSAGPADARSEMETIMTVSNEPVSWGFTGVLLGVYCTTNGGTGSAPAYISEWRYTPQGQFRD